MNDQDAEKVIAENLGGCDRIMPGKACANCSCGKAEYQASAEGKAALENG